MTYKKAGFLAFFSHSTYAQGASSPWQMGMQEPVTPIMQATESLHNTLLWIIAGIALLVCSLLVFISWRFHEKRSKVPAKFSHNLKLEIIWTLFPVLILAAIMGPSIKLLFLRDHIVDTEMTIKVTSYQWYWHYEYPDQKIAFDSYMIPDNKIQPGQYRLLEVDNPLVVPVNTNIRVILTSADVIHSWAVPALGIKKDTIPGRLSETWMRLTKEGTYYGQCSELCGPGHGFMPIAVKVVSKEAYLKWLEEKQEKVGV